MAGNVAIESMMGPWGAAKPLWFGGGRIDAFAPEEDVNWGHEPEWLKDDRHNHDTETGLDEPLGAVQMGLIYVNPVSNPSTTRVLLLQWCISNNWQSHSVPFNT